MRLTSDLGDFNFIMYCAAGVARDSSLASHFQASVDCDRERLRSAAQLAVPQLPLTAARTPDCSFTARLPHAASPLSSLSACCRLPSGFIESSSLLLV